MQSALTKRSHSLSNGVLPQLRPALACTPQRLRQTSPRHLRFYRRPIGPVEAKSETSIREEGQQWSEELEGDKPKVLVAGAGITGLVSALGLLKQGFDVQIFERDMTAIRGEGKYRGPIQIQSNALAALEAIDKEMAEEVFEAGVVTGDRINGLCDGLTGEWYVKFDTFTPAAQSGLPVTRVINRVQLQEILYRYVTKWSSRGEDVVMQNCTVTGYEETSTHGNNRVHVILEDGRRFSGDVLIGADGIWSKIRTQLFGPAAPTYSKYTCYTGIADFVPADIDTVGYRVFLGNGKYFVTSDVGCGKMQWYGFHKEPEGGDDPIGQRKARLLDIFGTWCDHVVDLIHATPEEDVLRRDIYDKPPMFQWNKGAVVIMGDAAHAMQPNLGQGGCMAIEDAFQLCLEFGSVLQASGGNADSADFINGIQTAVKGRALRAAVIHFLAAMAARSASTYKTYMGEGLGPLTFITRYKIPHFGKVAGQVILKLFMPYVMGWVLGGNVQTLKRGAYTPQCRLEDRPQAYDLSEFRRFVHDNRQLERAAIADWMLIPENQLSFENGHVIDGEGILVGSDAAADLQLTQAEPRHALIFKTDAESASTYSSYHVKSLARSGTYLNGRRLSQGQIEELAGGDIIYFGHSPTGTTAFKIKLRHISERNKTEPKSLNEGKEAVLS